MSTVTVGFCCNDDHGNDSGRVCEVAIDDEDITVAGPDLTFRRWPIDKVQVGRRRFEAGPVLHWYGNLLWDAYAMDAAEARRLIAYLIERGWRAESGPTEGAWADLFRAAK